MRKTGLGGAGLGWAGTTPQATASSLQLVISGEKRDFQSVPAFPDKLFQTPGQVGG